MLSVQVHELVLFFLIPIIHIRGFFSTSMRKILLTSQSNSGKQVKFLTLYILLAVISCEVSCINLINELLQVYEQNRLPFREDVFHGNQPILKEYDFIIVGSGPAGSAVANRLSEIGDWNILLLEAGVEGTIYNDMPVISPSFILSNYSWGYKTEKQSNICLGLEDQVCLWPSGRGMGGASIINGMLYTRGPKKDYDDWANLGNEGWSYDEVLPYFLKSESITIPNLKYSRYHSTTGHVQVEYPYPSKLIDRYIDAMIESGYNWVDYNNPNTPIGTSYSQVTMKKGRRHSATKAYLYPIKDKENFHMVKNAIVTKVLIDPETKKARGVQFKKNGKYREVLAKKEVVLSAGAFNSPKLLMLSGIGPKSHLNEMEIPVIMDLPVGNGLQEHLTTSLTFLINTTDSFTLNKLLPNMLPNLINWLNYGIGPIANNIPEALGYIPINNSTGPEIEFIFIPLTLGFDGGILFRKTMGITDDTYFGSFSEINNQEGFSVWPMGMYPESRGSVRLRSNDPLDPPKIIANFLENPRDVKIILEGLKAAIKLGETKSFQKIGAKLYTKPLKGCEHEEFASDNYFECALRTIPIQLHHQCCTAQMGNNENSVVDSSLKVHGIQGLRVADTSIMPKITGAHTMATAYMIGEKAADLIKKDWLNNY